MFHVSVTACVSCFSDCVCLMFQRPCMFNVSVTECAEGDFLCAHDGYCLPHSLVCDGHDDCGDGSDEMGCGT